MNAEEPKSSGHQLSGKIRPEQVTFIHPPLQAGHVSRSIVRIISYAFFIVVAGAVVASLISNVPRLRWAGVLAVLIIIDYLLHARLAPYSVRELMEAKVPHNNAALCVDRETLHHLVAAYEKSNATGGDFVMLLLEGLLDRPAISSVLQRLDIDLKEFRNAAGSETGHSIPKPAAAVSKNKLRDLMRSLLTLAAYEADAHGRRFIESETLFEVIVASDDPHVRKMRDTFSIVAQDIHAAIVFGYFSSRRLHIPLFTGGFSLKTVRVKPHRINRSFTSRPTPILDAFSEDVTDLARMGLEGFLIGHAKEYEQMIEILSRSGNRNVLLVGEPGIGKESLVAHLAFNIISDNVPAPLFDRRLVKLSVGNLISGASFEELSRRLNAVVAEIHSAGNIILYISDIHQLALTSHQGELNLSDMLMPIIRSGAFPVIGVTYPREYKQLIESKTDFAQSFEIVRVSQITPQEATVLLSYDSLIYERQHNLMIHFSAIKQAVALAEKYFHYKPLPASARDLLREAIAAATQQRKRDVKGEDIVHIAEQKVNIPIHKTSLEEAQTLLNLEEVIHKRYINQEEAVTAVAQALRAYRSGLSRKGGPIAAFLFVGPTGVGKTELAKIISDIQFGSEKYLVRFDMSEYQEKQSISRFIGSPDGKIAGALTESIIQQPYSTVLLDEFEKAHPDVLNLFLQVFDDGRLTDNTGRVVDFQNTIIIATSNAHSVYIQEQLSAGRTIQEFSEELKKKLFSYFKLELLNRFSDVVVFKPLSPENIVSVARLALKDLAVSLQSSQGIVLVYSDEVVEKIAKDGYEPALGARPLRKVIDSQIKSELAKEILAQEIQKGQAVNISLDSGGKFVFSAVSQ